MWGKIVARIPNEEVEKRIDKCLEGRGYLSTKNSINRCVTQKLERDFRDIVSNEDIQSKTQRTVAIGKLIDKKQFDYAIRILHRVLKDTGTIIHCDDYDGLIVKNLAANNTARQHSPGSDQTHMEFSGKQKYIFPFLTAREYFDPSNTEGSDEVTENSLLSSILKNYFLLKIPISLRKSNLFYLENGENYDMDEEVLSSCSTVLLDSRDRMEVSSQLTMDGHYFEKLRDLLRIGDYFILLKKKGIISYDAYGIKQDYITDDNDEFKKLNNKFFCREVITEVRPNMFNGVVDDFTVNRVDNGKNLLYYGVPGSGKSHKIKKLYEKDESTIERVIFHPDYSYSDFIGQILPEVNDEDIDYKFNPGPFTLILEKAYKDPSKHYYLIIEEINRGNAPAIFGDVFQLLDRRDNSSFYYKKGTSEFGITNQDIAKEVYGEENKNHKVRIPSNLSIIASMNTSDQNVFTLDTAFKRRWHMEMIENDFSKPKFKDWTILKNSNITWQVFGEAINEIILENANSTLSSEDKRLGAFFIDEDDFESSKQFAEKVLMYLWDDVFKFDREKYFNKGSVDQFSLEKFIEKFEKTEERESFIIFTSEINEKIKEVKKRLEEEGTNSHEEVQSDLEIEENDSEKEVTYFEIEENDSEE